MWLCWGMVASQSLCLVARPANSASIVIDQHGSDADLSKLSSVTVPIIDGWVVSSIVPLSLSRQLEQERALSSTASLSDARHDVLS